MGTPLDLYSNAYVYFDGALLTQESSVSISKKSGLNLVKTAVLGLAGASQGSTMVEISIENAIPSADFEVNPDKFMRTGKVVKIDIVVGGSATSGKVTSHDCFVMETDYSHSVDDAAKMSIKLTGKFQDFA